MRRGGKWSWKWFALNVVAWLSFFALFIKLGDSFGVAYFANLKNIGVEGLIGLVVASLILSPASYFVIQVLNGAVQRKLENLARDEQKLSKHCRLICDEKRFKEHQTRLVCDATEFIFATGSRSRDKDYLAHIEKRLTEVSTLTYTRILFGQIKREELLKHCLSLTSNGTLSPRVVVCEVNDLDRHTESFFIVNEHEALVVIPSINTIGKFDSGLLMTGPLHRRAKAIVESYARAAALWTPPASIQK